ncbi:MAG TPA: CPBP family intramembrane glutamic endopeptidase [Rubrobacteraceae bacterium]|nr:CPBP family intramembrane glutamic endopeptidase [Rubrobacteraceae bacterium]
MSAAILTFLATLFIGGLGLLAQVARKNRGAEVTLIVVLLALSLLVAVLGAFIGLGLLLTATSGGAPGSERLAFVAAGGAALLAGVLGAGLCVPPLRRLMGGRLKNAFWADPPIFLALWLFVVVLANNAVSFLIFTQEPDVSRLFPGGRLSPGTILTSQLPFVAVALFGVGLGVRRSPRETLARLGYGPISSKQLGVVVLFIGAALAVSVAADALFAELQPDLYRKVGELSDSLFNPVGLSPFSAVLFGLLIGVGAGLGEETLFRGAVQPVLGILPTSILFASMHVQYGPSLLLGYVFLLSIGLGLLRGRINTTASFLAHAGYNSLAIILAYFFGM